jgi:hypothetical protein
MRIERYQTGCDGGKVFSKLRSDGVPIADPRAAFLEEAAAKNGTRSLGLVHSQRLLIALTQKGACREDAYRLVQRNAMPVWRGERDFQTLLERVFGPNG